MNNLLLRSITGIAYVVALVGCVLWSSFSLLFFFALVTALSVWEFGTNVNLHAGANVNRFITSAAGVGLVAALFQCASDRPNYVSFLPFVATLLYLLVSELYRNDETPLKNWGFAFASLLYVALPLGMIFLLSFVQDKASGHMVYTSIWPLSIFLFLWTSDTGAYLCGSAFSRFLPAKLFPRISPNKSWVGSVGGGLLCLVVATLLWHFTPSSFSLVQWWGLGLTVCVFGTWGDLVESLFKRHIGVKDSGKILPGHGGMLDRFDSAFLAIPAAVVYVGLIAPHLP